MEFNYIQDIIKKCSLENLINSLDNGLDTVISKDLGLLTQDEKQKIVIARAMAKDANIVIIDKTSLNYNFEKDGIMSSLNYLLKDKTAIIIANISDDLDLADKKYIMQNGKLVLN